MNKIHIGNGLTEIYAGTKDKTGDWVHKSKVTNEARMAVMTHRKDLMLERGLAYSRERFVFTDGTRLTVEYHLEQAQM